MPGSFPKEARKAQAIVARTYALYQAVRRRSSEYDVYADSRSQQYPGFQYRDKNGRRLAGENSKSRAIAFATLGIVCRSRGKLFHTYYSAVCGGRTLLGTEVFSDATTAFHSTRCEWCRQAKRYRWTHTIPHAVLASSLRDYFRKQRKAFGRLKSVSQVATSPGRLPEFVISDGRQGYQLTGAELRKIFGGSKIPSSRFSIQPVGSGLKLIGQGHGHGVGLCQWGAAGLASAGSNASQILRYYYRGITIEPHTR